MYSNRIIRVFDHVKGRLKDCLTRDRWSSLSWSQEGEDLVLSRIFEKTDRGFYVDVGAHHPKRFSNTYLLYQKGWKGINIDPRPGCMRLFNKWRPRDTNLEMGVGTVSGFQKYYVFNEPALNSFDKHLSDERVVNDDRYSIKEVIEVPVLPLAEILAKHLKSSSIDFLTVDVEGRDLDVLQSNDWEVYRPCYVLAEALGGSLHSINEEPISQFLASCGYKPFAKQVNTVFFRDVQKG